jgi:hypothetical protein
MRNLFITTVLLALSLGTFAQTQKWQSPQDAKNSAELQLILKNNEEISKRLVAEKAKTINYPVRQVEANGRIIELVEPHGTRYDQPHWCLGWWCC